MWLGLDVGGANLKVADGDRYAAAESFPLWQSPERLADTLREMIGAAPPSERIAVTMTAELADCFATKAEGVAHVLDAVESAAAGRPVCVYRVDGSFVETAAARTAPLSVAAANWHALAKFAGRFAPDGTAILFDVGSTTTDIIPLVGGVPVAEGKNDPQRLIASELVYTGVQRSPICAVVQAVPWRGNLCPVAQELFATTWDAYLTLGDLPEEPNCTQTADGRPATITAARDRLARAICADRTMFDAADARAASIAVARAQEARIGIAAANVAHRLTEPPSSIILSGLGEFLARRVVEKMRIEARIISLVGELGEARSRCATAQAVAVLAREAFS